MGGMVYGMLWALLLTIFLLLGFAYILWVLASKETGGAKTTGQVIAIAIAVLTLVILISAGVYGPRMGRMGMMGGAGICGPGSQMKGSGMMERQEKGMMQGQPMQKMMRERREKTK